jgi:rod shape-determining protein MreD
MRWFAYLILAYLALGLQVGLGDYVAFRGATPNLVLLAVIFLAINAPREAALIGCFGLGVLHDLLTHQAPGLYALGYGLVALTGTRTNQVVYRDHPLTHVSMAFGGGLLVAAILLLHAWIYPPGASETRWVGGAGAVPATQLSLAAVRPSAATELVRVAYTAVLAPVVLGVLQRVRRAFAFQPGRRKLNNRV